MCKTRLAQRFPACAFPGVHSHHYEGSRNRSRASEFSPNKKSMGDIHRLSCVLHKAKAGGDRGAVDSFKPHLRQENGTGNSDGTGRPYPRMRSLNT
ncbi:hypothetical protein LA080_011703 [Diaporthe eres]|nr:hypothetical protein LA080_011703 [Diaporthe eres]